VNRRSDSACVTRMTSRDRFEALLRELSHEYDLAHSKMARLPAKADVSSKARTEINTPSTVSAALDQEFMALLPAPGIPAQELPGIPCIDELKSETSDEKRTRDCLLDPETSERREPHPTDSTILSITDADHKRTGAFEDPSRVKDASKTMSDEIAARSSTRQSASKLLDRQASSFKTAPLKESGLLARIANHKNFELFSLSAVILNGIWIAIDADYNKQSFLLDADPVFQVMEHLFCAVFNIELFVRFFAFQRKRDALCDPWFIFDASLVSLMVVETWIMTLVIVMSPDGSGGIGINASVLRLLRLVRLCRLTRIIRTVPELGVLVKGIIQATRSVACTIFLLLGLLYVFGIVLRLLSDNTVMGLKYFSSVPHSMFTLFAQGTLLDSISTLLLEVNRESYLCALILLGVVLFSSFTLMNMLVGVLCQVMTNVADTEADLLSTTVLTEQIKLTLAELDTNEDDLISKKEFEHIILNPRASEALLLAGVNVVDLVDFADFYFQSDEHGEAFDEKLSFDQFMEIITQVRGITPASVRDIVDLRRFLRADSTGRNVALKCLQDGQKTLAHNQARIQSKMDNFVKQ